jgi:hypothetical protein
MRFRFGCAAVLVLVGVVASCVVSPSASEASGAIDTNQIVYATSSASQGQIGFIDADGTHQRSITFPPANYPGQSAMEPDLSPDGLTVAFVYNDGLDSCAGDTLDTIHADGSGLQQVPGTSACIFHPVWSPDGTKIAYAQQVSISKGNSIYTIAPGGGTPTQVVPPGGDADWPSWSPDGSRIAYSNGGQIFTVPSSGGPPVQVTHLSSPDNAENPLWSPDGTKIAFCDNPTNNPPSPSYEMTVTPQGSGLRRLFANCGATSWSPDSHRLVVSNAQGHLQIVGLSGQVDLTLPVASAAWPSWIRTSPSNAAGGYRMSAADGGVFTFGDAAFYGSAGNLKLAKPVVGMAATLDGGGYWLVASDGGIFTFGDAGFYGSTGSLRLAAPVVGMAPTPDGNGYWLVAADGGVFSFGDAAFYGSTGSLKLAKPVVAMQVTPDGKGYWLVASDGGVFSFGHAAFYGSTGNIELAKPVVAMAATPDGAGYWLAAADGGIFSFGDASYHGSASGSTNAPIVGITPTSTGLGYRLAGSDGSVYPFGNANFNGQLDTTPLRQPVVGIAG